MKTWRNGEKASMVQQIINDNFATLEKNMPKHFTKTIFKTDWGSSNTISIPFSEHRILNPIVCLYISFNDEYILTEGGCSVDEDFNITLSTDLAFLGKVVIK